MPVQVFRKHNITYERNPTGLFYILTQYKIVLEGELLNSVQLYRMYIFFNIIERIYVSVFL